MIHIYIALFFFEITQSAVLHIHIKSSGDAVYWLLITLLDHILTFAIHNSFSVTYLYASCTDIGLMIIKYIFVICYTIYINIIFSFLIPLIMGVTLLYG